MSSRRNHQKASWLEFDRVEKRKRLKPLEVSQTRVHLAEARCLMKKRRFEDQKTKSGRREAQGSGQAASYLMRNWSRGGL